MTIDRHAAAAIRAQLATTTVAALAQRVDAGALVALRQARRARPRRDVSRPEPA